MSSLSRIYVYQSVSQSSRWSGTFTAEPNWTHWGTTASEVNTGGERAVYARPGIVVMMQIAFRRRPTRPRTRAVIRMVVVVVDNADEEERRQSGSRTRLYPLPGRQEPPMSELLCIVYIGKLQLPRAPTCLAQTPTRT